MSAAHIVHLKANLFIWLLSTGFMKNGMAGGYTKTGGNPSGFCEKAYNNRNYSTTVPEMMIAG